MKKCESSHPPDYRTPQPRDVYEWKGDGQLWMVMRRGSERGHRFISLTGTHICPVGLENRWGVEFIAANLTYKPNACICPEGC